MSAAEAEVKTEVKEEETPAEEVAEGQEEGNEAEGNAEGEDGGEGDGANGEDEDLLLLDEVGGDDKKDDEGKEDEEEGDKAKTKEKQGGTNRLISIHEYQLDRVIDINDRTIFIGPLLLEDLKNDKLQEYMSKKAKRFYIKYDNNDGDVKGHIELLFKSEEEALEAEKDLQGIKESITVKQNNEEFKKSQEYKELKFGPADEGTSIKRTLVIKGTPKPITKEELLEKIPDAVHVILPKRGTPPEYPGFAFVEMPTVERADSMVDQKIEFTGEKTLTATLQKFDHVPSIDVLFRLIDKNGFDRQLSSPLTTPRFQRLQTLILQCHYYERCGFLVKSQKLESLKRRTEMLVSRRTEHKRLLRRFDNRKRPGPYSPRNSYPPKRPRYNSRGGFNDRGPRHDWNEGPGWGPPPLMDYGGPRGGYDDGYWGDDYSYGSYDGYDDFGRNDRGRRMPPGGPMRDRSGPRGGGNRYGGGSGGNRYGGNSSGGGSGGGRGGRGKRGSGYRGKY